MDSIVIVGSRLRKLVVGVTVDDFLRNKQWFIPAFTNKSRTFSMENYTHHSCVCGGQRQVKEQF